MGCCCVFKRPTTCSPDAPLMPGKYWKRRSMTPPKPLPRHAMQILHCIACLGNGLGGVIERRFQYLPGINGASGEQVVGRLKTQQQPMEALQQRIVEIPRDASSFGK